MNTPTASSRDGFAETIAKWYERAARAWRGPYARLLEAQVARERDEVTRQREEIDRLRADMARKGAEIDTLREENRALLNSLLGTVGVPPIETLIAKPVQIAPVRRRSWPQISAAREAEHQRKPRDKAGPV